MASKECLVVLVHQIFDDEESSNVIEQGVLHSGVELNGIGVLSVVAKRMVHLNHLLLTLLWSLLLHCSYISWSFVSLFCSKDA